MTLEVIIWYLVLLDSLFANLGAWCFPKKYKQWMGKTFWKQLPITKAWSAVYLALVLWIGWGLQRLGILY